MSTYAEIQKQIADLQQKADEARRAELSQAKDQIAKIMREHGLTLADLATSKPQKPSKERGTVEPKYKNPATSEVWTGRGRAPKWIEGQDREQFLIQPAQA